jgi:chromosome segregation ATPase
MTEQEQYVSMLAQQNQQLSAECTERMKIIAMLSRQLASLEGENVHLAQRLQKAEIALQQANTTLKSYQSPPPEDAPHVPEPEAL